MRSDDSEQTAVKQVCDLMGCTVSDGEVSRSPQYMHTPHTDPHRCRASCRRREICLREQTKWSLAAS